MREVKKQLTQKKAAMTKKGPDSQKNPSDPL